MCVHALVTPHIWCPAVAHLSAHCASSLVDSEESSASLEKRETSQLLRPSLTDLSMNISYSPPRQTGSPLQW